MHLKQNDNKLLRKESFHNKKKKNQFELFLIILNNMKKYKIQIWQHLSKYERILYIYHVIHESYL